MKRFAILCISLAIIASLPTSSSAQVTTKSNTPVVNSNSSMMNYQNSKNIDPAVLEELEKQKQQQEEKTKAAFSKDNKLDDISYVRRRMRELEHALYNKTKSEEAGKQQDTSRIAIQTKQAI